MLDPVPLPIVVDLCRRAFVFAADIGRKQILNAHIISERHMRPLVEDPAARIFVRRGMAADVIVHVVHEGAWCASRVRGVRSTETRHSRTQYRNTRHRQFIPRTRHPSLARRPSAWL